MIVKHTVGVCSQGECMPMSRAPRQLLTGWIAHKRPIGCPQMTWGRTLKNREISKRGALLLLTESTGEAFAGPSSTAQLKCLRQTPREQDGSHSPRTRSIIRTKEENCIKHLSQGSEGTGKRISGLNSSSSCYDLSGSER